MTRKHLNIWSCITHNAMRTFDLLKQSQVRVVWILISSTIHLLALGSFSLYNRCKKYPTIGLLEVMIEQDIQGDCMTCVCLEDIRLDKKKHKI